MRTRTNRNSYDLTCLGTAFGHFLLGSHNFMVIALGLCVKWPKANEVVTVIFSNWDGHICSRQDSSWCNTNEPYMTNRLFYIHANESTDFDAYFFWFFFFFFWGLPCPFPYYSIPLWTLSPLNLPRSSRMPIPSVNTDGPLVYGHVKRRWAAKVR